MTTQREVVDRLLASPKRRTRIRVPSLWVTLPITGFLWIIIAGSTLGSCGDDDDVSRDPGWSTVNDPLTGVQLRCFVEADFGWCYRP